MKTIGFSCKCKSDFVDVSPPGARSGILCRRRVNECSAPKQYAVDCDSNAVGIFILVLLKKKFFRIVSTQMTVLFVVADQDLWIYLNNLIDYRDGDV